MTNPDQLTPLPSNKLWREDAHLAALVAMGLILFLFEAAVPRPLPWLKAGLANIATLIALFWYGPLAALLVTFSRILGGALFTGNFLSPGFFLSLGGGTLAVLSMILLYQTRRFGLWGVSLTGAAFHNLGQILVAYFFLFQNLLVLQLLPYLVLYSLLSGTIIGFLSFVLLKRLKKEFAF